MFVANGGQQPCSKLEDSIGLENNGIVSIGPAISGVTCWHEFYDRMKKQHQRIIDAVGAEAFHAESTRLFPLALDDDACFSVASALGWHLDGLWFHNQLTIMKNCH